MKAKFCKPGDVIEWRCPKFPDVVHRWRVRGCHLGGLNQESLIEIESLTHLPGTVEHVSPFGMAVLWVPEPLLRDLTIVESV